MVFPTLLDKTASTELTVYFLKVVINWTIPALCVFLAYFLVKKATGGGSSSSGMMGGGGMDGRNWPLGMRDGDKTATEELYDDLYGDPDGNNDNPAGMQFLKNFLKPGGPNKPSPKNLGIPPKLYIKMDRLNDVYDSYAYSMNAATKSKSFASSELRAKNFDRALGKALASPLDETSTTNGEAAAVAKLSLAEKYDLLRLEEDFLKRGMDLERQLMDCQTQLTKISLEKIMDKMDVEVGELDPHEENDEKEKAKDDKIVDAQVVASNQTTTTSTTTSSSKPKKSETSQKQKQLYKDLATTTTELTKLEVSFLESILELLGAKRANALRVALLGNVASGNMVAGTLLKNVKDRPLSVLLGEGGLLPKEADSTTPTQRKNIYVTEFPGDVTASQVAQLREEVTAILLTSTPNQDEAVLILQSGGGTVTGYGLAAAQLRRLKDAGLKLTICVEQVAASGGYMMCCVADRIVASPFAVLGSIGVISEMPNLYERLKKEGVEVQTVTAGKYKRTITPTKKITQADVDKSKQDLENVLKLFKSFVKENRPQVDIDKVATGETWFGEDALEQKLCDEIKTKDDVLMEFVKQGCEVYEVKYDPPMDLSRANALFPLGSGSRGSEGMVRRPIRWLVRMIAEEVRGEVMAGFGRESGGGSGQVEKRFMAVDSSDAKNRVKATGVGVDERLGRGAGKIDNEDDDDELDFVERLF